MSRPPLALFLFLAAPLHAADDSAKKITFDDVAPVFRAKCGGCHNADKKEAGLNLLAYADLMQGGGSGDAIEPGDADSSYLWLVVSHEIEPVMPPSGGKIDEASLKLIRDWIDGGGLETADSKVRVKKKPDLSLVGAPAGRPEGPPPMPGRLAKAPSVVAPRADAATTLAVSPWAPLVAVGGVGQVVLYDTNTLDLLGVLPFPEGSPESLAFSRTGRVLVAGGGRGAYRGLAVLWDVTTGGRIGTVGDETDSVLAADLSPDQRHVAIGGPNRLVKVLDVVTGEVAYSIKKHTDWVLALGYSPDGVLLASADRNGGVHLWEAASGLPYADLRGHKDAVTAVAWRSDSNLLVTGSLDGSVKLWGAERGDEVKSWNVPGGGVEDVSFARDGRIVTAARDGRVRLYDQGGKQIREFRGLSDYALSVAFADESDRVLGGDWNGNVAVWAADGLDPVGTLTPNPPTLAAQLAAAEGVRDAAVAARAALDAPRNSAEQAVRDAEAKVAAAEQALAAAKRLAAETAAGRRAAEKTVAAAAEAKASAEQRAGRAAKIAAALRTARDALNTAVAADGTDDALKEHRGRTDALLAERENTAAEASRARDAAIAALKQAETASAAAAKVAEQRAKEVGPAETRLEAVKPAVTAAEQTLATVRGQVAAADAAVAAAETAVAGWREELAFADDAPAADGRQASAE